MEQFFHGQEGKTPSQIKMMAEGVGRYKELYEKKSTPITRRKSSSNNKKSPLTSYYLKGSLCRDDSRLYYQGSDITFRDLEKKNRTGTAVLNGRQLTDMAKRGTREFRKAMGYTKDKWDFKKNEPKQSGMTVDDVIDYVRERMYMKSVICIDSDDDDDVVINAAKMNSNEKEKEKKEEVDTLDSSTKVNDDDADVSKDIGDDDDDGDDKYDKEVCKKKKKVCKSHKVKGQTIKKKGDGNDGSNDGSSTDDNDDKDGDKDHNEDNDDNDDEKDHDNDNDNDDNDDNDDANDDDDDDVDDDEDDDFDDEEERVPKEYIFPSFMAYVLWGPFAPKEKQLTLFLLGKYNYVYSFIIK